MNKKSIIYKTPIGITPYIYWAISLIIIFFLSIHLKYNQFVISVFIILTILYMCLIYSDEILVRKDCFEVCSNRFFNLKKNKKIFLYSHVEKICFEDSKWEGGRAFIPIIPFRTGKEIIIILKTGETKKIKFIKLRDDNFKKAISLINQKLI